MHYPTFTTSGPLVPQVGSLSVNNFCAVWFYPFISKGLPHTSSAAPGDWRVRELVPLSLRREQSETIGTSLWVARKITRGYRLQFASCHLILLT